MKHWVSRLGLAALCSAIALPAGAAMAPFTWDPQQMPETVGTPRDPGELMAAMGQSQQNLAAQQVERGARAEAVVNVTAAERKSIDVPTTADGRYLVGVNKAIGATISFAGIANLGDRTRDLKLGAVRGDGHGGFTWTASVRSPGAAAMRVHVIGLDLPEGAGLYVYNEKGMAFGPYTGRGPLGDGDLFSNTVFGELLIMQLQAPAGVRVPGFRVEEVGVMGKRFLVPRYNPEGVFDPGDLASLGTAKAFCSYNASCVVNAACQSSGAVTTAKDAVATMLFTSGGSQYICTGQLIADTVTTSVIPYFLTAHHCISSSGEASSLETFFDYQTTCSSPNCTQPYSGVGDTVGATIKATGSSSDYSLLQLASTPTTPDGVATYLGWLSTAVANTNNYGLFRVSHPKGAPQAYSEGVVDTNKGTCRTLPRGSFIYSRDTLGATEGGSSGSAVVNNAGQIVGQLYGACGTNLNNVCDANSNATVDGAFAASYPNLAAFLSPGGGSCTPAGQSCTSNSQCCSNQCKGGGPNKTCR